MAEQPNGGAPEEQPLQNNPAKPAPRPSNVDRVRRALFTDKGVLTLTLLAVIIGAGILGGIDFRYAASLPDKIGAAVWLLAAIAALTAIIGLWLDWESWIVYAYIGLLLAIFLAIPVITDDLKSPVHQPPIIAAGVAVVAIALFWIYYLKRFVPEKIRSKFGTVATAVLAVTGAVVTLATTWYSTDYLPRTSIPKVDMTTELTEAGRTGSVVHLAAKITVANEGALTVQPFGSLMRVVGYPSQSDTQPSTPESISHAFDFNRPASDEYRQRTVDYRHRGLLYSDDFITYQSVLPPGANIVYQRIIDVDTAAFTRVRLYVTASFFNQQ
jgi:hypothetical protein